MNKKRFALVILVSQVLQATILSRLEILGASPNINIPLTIVLAIFYGPVWGGYTGLGLGLLEDIMFAPVLGVQALIYFLLGSLVGKSMKNTANRLPTGLLVTVLATLFRWLISSLIYLVLRIPFTYIHYWKGPLLAECLLNGILYLLVLFVLSRAIPSRPIRKFTGL
ncbi:MAG: rod shape-determining protein MreD [Firmicutes bacterium]|nr:rod shape-determining protein MreD [Bacillota bacterium]